MAKAVKSEAKVSSKDIEEGKAFAFLGVFLGIIGFVIVLLTKKENKYAMYYAKQGLVLTIAWVIVCIIGSILSFIFGITIVLLLIVPFIWGLLWICMLILWVIGWINALSGKEKPIPLIGQFAEKFNI
jgi:uncharacterized membrane protein